MIRSFADADTQLIWQTGKSRRIPANLRPSALKKLAVVDSAEGLADLAELPGNQLEALKRDRKGQYSVRINKQYRLCFAWAEPHAYEVEVVDYH